MSNKGMAPNLDQRVLTRRRWCRHSPFPQLLYIMVYVVLAVLVFAPVGPWSSSSVPTGALSGGPGVGDPTLMAWFLAWSAYAITHGHNIFFTNYVYAPHGTSLFPYTSIPLLGTIMTPFTLKLGPVAALNILIRLAVAGSATSMFLVLSSWCRRPYAFMGGLLFGFSPYLMTQSENHLNLAFLVLLPPIAWCVGEIVVVRRRSPWALGVALGVFTALQIYVSLEMIALIGLVMGLGSVGYLITIRSHIGEHFKYWARGVGAATVTLVVLAGYFLFNFLFGAGHIQGPVLPVSALQSYHADFLGPIIPTANLLVTSERLSYLSSSFVRGNVTENVAYLGIPLVAILAYFALRFRRHPKIIGPFALTAIALILSMGDRLTIASHNLHVPMPEKLLRSLPMVDNIVPARFGAIVVLFAAVTLALGIELIIDTRRTLGPALSAPRWVMPGVGLALLLSLIPAFPVTAKSQTTPPPLFAQLAVIPLGAKVLTYPYPIWDWSEPMIWQAQDQMRFRLFGGYIRPSPPPLLQPASVEQFFIGAEEGTIQRQMAATSITKRVAALRQFLALGHVGAIIFWNTGANPLAVRQLLDTTLGPPTRHVGNEFAIWVLTSPRR